MTSPGFITFHIVNDIPWSNLNRDDTGTPKRTILGGVERGMLSSQSIKRAIRKDYESRILATLPETQLSAEDPRSPEAQLSTFGTLRSRFVVQWAVKRAQALLEERGGEPLDEKKAHALGNGIVKKLVGGEDTIVWFSIEELETLAQVLAEELSPTEEEAINRIFPENRKTGALAIAAFGRMFASANHKQTDAAVAVSPAISTHANLIETDYFIAGDDYGFFKRDKGSKEVTVNFEGAGAAHLGLALYTSGVFYRTVTVDVRELQRNWTGVTSEFAEVALTQLVKSIVHSLPTGKKNHTAPYTTLPLVLVEQQHYREALSIATPVTAPTEGGFLEPTIEGLLKQHLLTRRFNASNYGEGLVTGQFAEAIASEARELREVTVEELTASVVSWLLAGVQAKEVSLSTLEAGE